MLYFDKHFLWNKPGLSTKPGSRSKSALTSLKETRDERDQLHWKLLVFFCFFLTHPTYVKVHQIQPVSREICFSSCRECESLWGLRNFSLSHACHKTKNIFLYFFTELKTYHLPYSTYKLVSSYLIDTLNIYIISKIYTDSFLHIILTL